jgi:hypothetical protein
MKRERTSYLKSLCSSDRLGTGDLDKFLQESLPRYKTANPVHAREVRDAAEQLRQHFNRRNPPRPFNAMILGGPGSGKTFLAKQLNEAADAQFKEYNLSQFQHPSQIQQCFVDAASWLKSNPCKNLLVFFDEFDVRISGISAIQYLIQPIYDGKIPVAGYEFEFKQAAFLFSGSYLKERRLFDSLVGGEQLDLARILFDTYYATFRESFAAEYHEQVWKDLMAVTAYDSVRQQLSLDRDVVVYVRSLEKIVDFVSRINGFVLELRNLNSPLHATRNLYRIELEVRNEDERSDAAAVAPDPQVAAQLLALVDGLRRGEVSERFYDYTDVQQPILEYKNLLLIDRLVRVADLIRRTHGVPVRISRALLNYLVTVPLVHGMRSLSTIIESLSDQPGVLVLPMHRGVLERNIGRFAEYQNPDAVWNRVRRYNPIFAADSLMHSDGAEIITVE